jgi:hypothetical protein
VFVFDVFGIDHGLPGFGCKRSPDSCHERIRLKAPDLEHSFGVACFVDGMHIVLPFVPDPAIF